MAAIVPKNCLTTNELSTNNKNDKNNKFFSNYTRYVVLFISTICLSLIMSNSLALNFTIICMMPTPINLTATTTTTTTEISSALNNKEVESNENVYNYSATEISLLFSAIAFGTILGSIPITFFTSSFGTRRTITAYGVLSAISTLLTPLCAWLGFFPLLVMRFFQGVGVSTSFPAMGMIITHWSTLRNSGMYIAILSCHLQFGSIFIMPISGELCESRWGWPAVYYLQGVLTLLAFFGFYLFYRDSPRFHRNVSAKELKTIQKNKNMDEDLLKQKVPYSAIFKDVAVLGIIASNFGGNLGFQIFMQYGPTYLNKALNYDIKKTGFAAALPYVFSAILKFICGPFSDYFTFVSAKARVIIFSTVSQISMAFCFILLSFLSVDHPILIQTCFTLCTVFSGLNCVGVAKSTQLISRQFSHFLMAITAIIASLVVLLIPLIVQYMAPNNSQEEWGRIFILIGIICIITTIIFDFTAEADPRPWTYKKSNSTHYLAKNILTADSLTPENNKENLFVINLDSHESNERKVSVETNKVVDNKFCCN